MSPAAPHYRCSQLSTSPPRLLLQAGAHGHLPARPRDVAARTRRWANIAPFRTLISLDHSISGCQTSVESAIEELNVSHVRLMFDFMERWRHFWLTALADHRPAARGAAGVCPPRRVVVKEGEDARQPFVGGRGRYCAVADTARTARASAASRAPGFSRAVLLPKKRASAHRAVCSAEQDGRARGVGGGSLSYRQSKLAGGTTHSMNGRAGYSGRASPG